MKSFRVTGLLSLSLLFSLVACDDKAPVENPKPEPSGRPNPDSPTQLAQNTPTSDESKSDAPVGAGDDAPAGAMGIRSRQVPVCTAIQAPIRVMAYNVENLHDVEHDAGKDDWEYLPAGYPGKAEGCAAVENPFYRKSCEESDWTKARLDLKLSQIKRVVEASGTKPDVIALTEVENESSVAQLATVLGYERVFVTDSPDERGMDVALIVNPRADLKVVGTREHVIEGDLTRNILEVEFTLACGAPMKMFVNHWPSQSAPASVRMLAAAVLKGAIDETLAKNPATSIVATGDFNVISSDRPDPFFDGIQNPAWSNALVDLDAHHRAWAKREKKRLDLIPPGTYFFGTSMQWNLLDHAFLSKDLTDGVGLDVDAGSYEIVSRDFLRQDYTYPETHYLAGTVVRNTPKRADFRADTAETAGFSDHFPIVFTLK